jgi:3-hydroxyacyl-[acyl-carrier-protein] dehydratase
MLAEAKVKAEGKTVCNAGLTFRLMPFPSPDFRVSMEQVAARITFPMEAAAHG